MSATDGERLYRDYIRNAEQAEAKASAARDPAAKRNYFAKAANWRRLARYFKADEETEVDKRDKTDVPR
jgi:hypothetical protein